MFDMKVVGFRVCGVSRAAGIRCHRAVRAQGHVNEEQLAGLAKGVTVDGVTYGQVIAKLDRQMASNAPGPVAGAALHHPCTARQQAPATWKIQGIP